VVTLRRIKLDGKIATGGQERQPFTSGGRRRDDGDGEDGTSNVSLSL
jgi:hypothetical protein